MPYLSKTIRILKQDNINPTNSALLQQKCQEGKWYNWNRVFLLKSDKGFTFVSLNIFQRMELCLLKIFKVNYFKNVFGTKNIKIVSPSDFKPTDNKTNQQVKSFVAELPEDKITPINLANPIVVVTKSEPVEKKIHDSNMPQVQPIEKSDLPENKHKKIDDKQMMHFMNQGDFTQNPLMIEKIKKKQAAALKIQSVFRGHLARLTAAKAKRHLLSYPHFEQAKHYIDDPEKLGNMSLITNRIYAPKELPIIIKYKGASASRSMLEHMKQARELCEENRYSRLVIPLARVHGDFIIQSRLPLNNHSTKDQIGFYLDYLEEFTQAVQEFTGFLCQAYLGDLNGETYDPYSTLSKVPIGRYDNVPLYLEVGETGKQGKIGLIDFDVFDRPDTSKRNQKDWDNACRLACEQAVRLFPHHLDVIIRAAKKFAPSIEAYHERLEEERSSVLEYFSKAYVDHLDFVKKKGYTFENPIEFPVVDINRKKELGEVIEKTIRQEWFFKKVPEITLKLFKEQEGQIIVEAIIKCISDLMGENLKYMQQELKTKQGNTAISSYSQLISARTITLYGTDTNTYYADLKELIQKKLGILGMQKKPNEYYSKVIIDAILNELERGREIAYYNPSLGIGGFAIRHMFC